MNELTWSRFKRVASYYLDCVQEDESTGARHFLTDEGRRFLTLPIDSEWSLAESDAVNIQLPRSSIFARDLRQRGERAGLYYGYPLYVEWVKSSRSNWAGGFAIPVFLLPVEYELQGYELHVYLANDWPRVNQEFLSAAFASPEERRAFLEDLELLDVVGELPEEGLTAWVRRWNEIGITLPLVENLLPDNLAKTPPIPALDTEGLHNRAILVLGERPPYTRGLETELKYLTEEAEESILNSSALSMFFNNGHYVSEDEANSDDEEEPIEIVPLNDEQRAAIRSAFTNDLTVVTGPPGTGKSQVVLTVLANAYLKGQRVLFTSRNHKAVDVVETRLNGLSAHPIVLRTGSRSPTRDLRTELVRFLNQVLTLNVSEEDKVTAKATEDTYLRLAEQRDQLWKRLEDIRIIRNNIDRLDQELILLSQQIPENQWVVIKRLKKPLDFSFLDRMRGLVEYHLSGRLGLITRILRFVNKRRNLDTIQRLTEQIDENLFGVKPQRLVLESELHKWQEYLRSAEKIREAVEKLFKYKEIFTRLDQTPKPEQFAAELSSLEERLWETGERLIAMKGKLLPERLDESTRLALSQLRAITEELSQENINNRRYASLRREQERIFAQVTTVLPVWCVTNLSARGALPFESGIFDLVVIDEASQCDIASALPLFFRARRALIIGDPNQLRHISNLPRHRHQQIMNKHEMNSAEDQPFTFVNNSLFDLAASRVGSGNLIQLREHFRSHSTIVGFSNRHWYRDTLLICTDYRRLNYPSNTRPGIRWISTKGKTLRPSSGGAINAEEANAVVSELVRLLNDKAFSGLVGVVTPFRAQANRIRELITQSVEPSDIERCQLIVDTAHGFQGDERDVILFSPCVTEGLPRGARLFLQSTGNLFNVAITRARALLHVIGDLEACSSCGVGYLQDFANYVRLLNSSNSKESEPFVQAEDAFVGPWENTLKEALEVAGLKVLPQYPVNQYRLDLAIVDGDSQIDIEVDGEMYHKEWDGSRARRDVIRDMRLSALGWTVKRFWVYQVRDNLQGCVDQIRSLVAGNM